MGLLDREHGRGLSSTAIAPPISLMSALWARVVGPKALHDVLEKAVTLLAGEGSAVPPTLASTLLVHALRRDSPSALRDFAWANSVRSGLARSTVLQPSPRITAEAWPGFAPWLQPWITSSREVDFTLTQLATRGVRSLPAPWAVPREAAEPEASRTEEAMRAEQLFPYVLLVWHAAGSLFDLPPLVAGLVSSDVTLPSSSTPRFLASRRQALATRSWTLREHWRHFLLAAPLETVVDVLTVAQGPAWSEEPAGARNPGSLARWVVVRSVRRAGLAAPSAAEASEDSARDAKEREIAFEVLAEAVRAFPDLAPRVDLLASLWKAH